MHFSNYSREGVIEKLNYFVSRGLRILDKDMMSFAFLSASFNQSLGCPISDSYSVNSWVFNIFSNQLDDLFCVVDFSIS